MFISPKSTIDHTHWNVKSNGAQVKRCLYVDTDQGIAHCIMASEDGHPIHSITESLDDCCPTYDLYTFELYHNGELVFKT